MFVIDEVYHVDFYFLSLIVLFGLGLYTNVMLWRFVLFDYFLLSLGRPFTNHGENERKDRMDKLVQLRNPFCVEVLLELT
jgi:hypothetical protein